MPTHELEAGRGNPDFISSVGISLIIDVKRKAKKKKIVIVMLF
jgi:hypothetical protein